MKAQASLRIRAVSPEPSLFAHMKYATSLLGMTLMVTLTGIILQSVLNIGCGCHEITGCELSD